MADPVALDQIVHNLILNALQALEQVPTAQRRLTLTLRTVDGTVGGQGELAVADSGPGIPPDVLPRLFEPFFSTREGGLGLGLSLCETLASGMGGSLSAANNTTGGAVFRLRLPLAVRDSLALLIGTVGLRVQPWSDPQAFLNTFDREAIGAIVLDVRMPGISGLS
eukprot:gene13500-18218_t